MSASIHVNADIIKERNMYERMFDGVGAVIIDAHLVGDRALNPYVAFNGVDGENVILHGLADHLKAALSPPPRQTEIIIRREEPKNPASVTINYVAYASYYITLRRSTELEGGTSSIIGSVGLEISRMNARLGATSIPQRLFIVKDDIKSVRAAISGAMIDMADEYVVAPLEAAQAR
jgi:hypothetical protein